MSVLLYGCETLTATQEIINKLQILLIDVFATWEYGGQRL
jgi:hypothetical protein